MTLHGQFTIYILALNKANTLIGDTKYNFGCRPPLHPKLRNINLHNVTHSLTYQNRRERMFVVQISLLIVTFLSLISRNLSLMQITKEVNPHPRIVPCVNMWNVTFLILFFFFYLYHLLLTVGACVAASPKKAKWSGPH